MRYSLNGMIVSDDDAPVWKWFGWQAVCPADLRQAVAANPENEEFVLEINSSGGSVYAGFEMYSLLRAAKPHIRIEVQSLAGSAASVVMAAGDTVAASPVGQVMIHLPSTQTEGNQIDHRQSTQMLEAVTTSILAAYTTKCKGKVTRDALRSMMEQETFLTAQQALDIGLIDEIIGTEQRRTSPMDVYNAAGGMPDIEKLRAAYQKARCGENLDTAQARARAITLAEEELTMFMD